MTQDSLMAHGVLWPFALLSAWIVGELFWRTISIPRLSTYALSGFVFSILFPAMSDITGAGAPTLIANVAFGLILFECGNRMNIRWLIKNYWILVSGIVEALLTFGAVFLMAALFIDSLIQCILIAALMMAASPAVLLKVINDEKSSGQVTERAIHLSAITMLISIFMFKMTLGSVIFQQTGHFGDAATGSILLFAGSAITGTAFGILVPAFLQTLKRTHADLTMAYALSVMCCVVLLDAISYSPVVGALAFGLVCRYRRQVPGVTQRGFGSLGELFSLFLFFYLATILDATHILQGFWLAAVLLLIRQAIKTLVLLLFARVSGISSRKSMLVGLATTPLSVFVLLSLENTTHYGLHIIDNVLPLAAACLIMEFLAPFLVRLSLVLARETSKQEDA